MIRIITPKLYQPLRASLTEMHRQRYRVFKERLGWEVSSQNGEERDSYDELNPTYILAFDETDSLVGSWRLLPTTGPNMLRDDFSILLEGEAPPEDPFLWECSRFVVDLGEIHEGNLAAVNTVTSEIFCGLIEHCLNQGIREVVTVYDIRIARLLPRIGCRPKRTTKIFPVGKTRALAGWFEISEEVLASVKDAGGISGSVIMPAGDQDRMIAA